MIDKITMWWTMRFTIPVGALFLAWRTLNDEMREEING